MYEAWNLVWMGIYRVQKYGFGQGHSIDRKTIITVNDDTFTVNATYILVVVNSKTFTI